MGPLLIRVIWSPRMTQAVSAAGVFDKDLPAYESGLEACPATPLKQFKKQTIDLLLQHSRPTKTNCLALCRDHHTATEVKGVSARVEKSCFDVGYIPVLVASMYSLLYGSGFRV